MFADNRTYDGASDAQISFTNSKKVNQNSKVHLRLLKDTEKAETVVYAYVNKDRELKYLFYTSVL